MISRQRDRAETCRRCRCHVSCVGNVSGTICERHRMGHCGTFTISLTYMLSRCVQLREVVIV